MDLKGTPSSHGFRMPAEWEPHSRFWIGCPERGDNWRDDAVHAQLVFTLVASKILRFESVTVCASASQVSVGSEGECSNPAAGTYQGRRAEYERFMAPGYLTNLCRKCECVVSFNRAKIAGIDWIFNSYGLEEGCYPDWSLDLLIARKAGARSYQDTLLYCSKKNKRGRSNCADNTFIYIG